MPKPSQLPSQSPATITAFRDVLGIDANEARVAGLEGAVGTQDADWLAQAQDANGNPAFRVEADGGLAAPEVRVGPQRHAMTEIAALALDSATPAKFAPNEDTFRFMDGINAQLAGSYAAAQAVFDASVDLGAPVYRLPSPVRLTRTRWLVFANAQSGFGDFAQTSLVYRTVDVASDGTLTLGAYTVLDAGGPDDGTGKAFQYQNPCVVRTNTGRLVVLYVYRNTDGLAHTPYMRYSDDDGATWTDRIDLSATFPQLGVTWNAIIFGPGRGIQIKHGPYAGRVVFPCWYSDMIYPSNTRGLNSFFLYSDDNCATFQVGAVSIATRGNECAVAEDWRGDLLLLIRREGKAGKWVARSSTGGENITDFYKLDQASINVPVVESGFAQAANDFDNSVPKLVMTSPKPVAAASNTTGLGRERLTVFVSYDGGRTFPHQALIDAGHCEYSAVDACDENSLLVFWESGASREVIKAQKVSLAEVLL